MEPFAGARRGSSGQRRAQPLADRRQRSRAARGRTPRRRPDGALRGGRRTRGPGPFFTTQPSSPPDESALRCTRVVQVSRFVARHAGCGFPPVLTGDLNAEPDTDEVRLVYGHKTAPAVPGQVLVDAWRYADPAEPGDTWDRRNPFVRATHEPSSRIDYILVGRPGSRGVGTSCGRGAAAPAPSPESGRPITPHSSRRSRRERGR